MRLRVHAALPLPQGRAPGLGSRLFVPRHHLEQLVLDHGLPPVTPGPGRDRRRRCRRSSLHLPGTRDVKAGGTLWRQRGSGTSDSPLGVVCAGTV